MVSLRVVLLRVVVGVMVTSVCRPAVPPVAPDYRPTPLLRGLGRWIDTVFKILGGPPPGQLEGALDCFGA